ncbi:hypothetical protein [Ideonella sp. BN130291]|uniref:hypothetical protein n=1 Tax=Ideonella sp. BN130291 TaxID=3112940 RepID=UPI002E272425|nr:hypothetical protein [Ideonella sp. BN130291]
MIRKLLLLAITTGVANKLYRQYRNKQGGLDMGKQGSMGSGTRDAEMNARSDVGTTTL